MISLQPACENPGEIAEGLNGLEQMGAFFSSQIHDLNNQMSCLCNTQLVLETLPEPWPDGSLELLEGLCQTINRLSRTISHFNEVRRQVSLQMPGMGCSEVAESVRKALTKETGWLVQVTGHPHGLVRANDRWLEFAIGHLVSSTGSESGVIRLKRGPLPPRHYSRAITTQPNDLFLLLFFDRGNQSVEFSATSPASGLGREIALELIRLMGAAISFGRSDRPDELLLALRLE